MHVAFSPKKLENTEIPAETCVNKPYLKIEWQLLNDVGEF